MIRHGIKVECDTVSPIKEDFFVFDTLLFRLTSIKIDDYDMLRRFNPAFVHCGIRFIFVLLLHDQYLHSYLD